MSRLLRWECWGMSNPPEIAGYTLLSLLAQGAASQVYLARPIGTARLVAIKLLHPNTACAGAAYAQLVAAFNHEIELCSTFHHPHIVKLLAQGSNNEAQPYAVFEYNRGVTLHDLLCRQGFLSAIQTRRVMGQVLAALVHIHAHGIVHRDLKPHNIMVSGEGAAMSAKVLDFGISALASPPSNDGFCTSHDHKPSTGTPRYSAPEQLRGAPATASADLYAWGLILLECLTGRPVFDGKTLAHIYRQQLDAEPIRIPLGLSQHRLGLLLQSVLSKNPSARTLDAPAVYRQFLRLDLPDEALLYIDRNTPRTDLGLTTTLTLPVHN